MRDGTRIARTNTEINELARAGLFQEFGKAAQGSSTAPKDSESCPAAPPGGRRSFT